MAVVGIPGDGLRLKSLNLFNMLHTKAGVKGVAHSFLVLSRHGVYARPSSVAGDSLLPRGTT